MVRDRSNDQETHEHDDFRSLRRTLNSEGAKSALAAAASKNDQRTYSFFTRLVALRLDTFLQKEGSWTAKKDAYRAAGLETQVDFERESIVCFLL